METNTPIPYLIQFGLLTSYEDASWCDRWSSCCTYCLRIVVIPINIKVKLITATSLYDEPLRKKKFRFGQRIISYHWPLTSSSVLLGGKFLQISSRANTLREKTMKSQFLHFFLIPNPPKNDNCLQHRWYVQQQSNLGCRVSGCNYLLYFTFNFSLVNGFFDRIN